METSVKTAAANLAQAAAELSATVQTEPAINKVFLIEVDIHNTFAVIAPNQQEAMAELWEYLIRSDWDPETLEGTLMGAEIGELDLSAVGVAEHIQG